MEDYWLAISEKHKAKVRYLAAKHNIPTERAFSNLLKNLEWEIKAKRAQRAFREMLTISQVEQMLDQIGE